MTDQLSVPAPSPEVEKKTVIKVYGLLLLMILLGMTDSMVCNVIALLIFTALLPIATRLRRMHEGDTYTVGHMTYVIRTVWISTLFGILLIIFSVVYIGVSSDWSPLQPCAEKLLSEIQSGHEPNQIETLELEQPCVQPVLDTNRIIIRNARWATTIPLTLYLLLRLLRGLARARKNERIANPRSWI